MNFLPVIAVAAFALAGCQTTTNSTSAPSGQAAVKTASAKTAPAAPKLKPVKKNDRQGATWATRRDVVVGERTIEFAVAADKSYLLAREVRGRKIKSGEIVALARNETACKLSPRGAWAFIAKTPDAFEAALLQSKDATISQSGRSPFRNRVQFELAC